jgi:hypothetical protein
MSFLLTEEIEGQVENLPMLCMQEKHMISKRRGESQRKGEVVGLMGESKT